MELQLADSSGIQLTRLQYCNFDADLNKEKDFELSMDIAHYDKRIKDKCRVFVPDTEIGGLIGEPFIDTGTNTISFSGYAWRGLLNKKILIPPVGEDYLKKTGELNNILKELVEPRFSGLFKVSDKNTAVVLYNYQFDRFCTLYDGVVKMLKSVGYRLNIFYNQGYPNGSGWVEIEAVPIVDYSDSEELSQDSKLSFSMREKKNGVNHLIVVGKGELQERVVIHLYVQGDGSIGKEQYYTGIDEIEEVYENTSTDTAELEEAGTEQLQELMNCKTLKMDVASLGIDISIGDIIGGRDQITGMYMAKPLDNIIVTIKDGVMSKEYKLEGAD